MSRQNRELKVKKAADEFFTKRLAEIREELGLPVVDEDAISDKNITYEGHTVRSEGHGGTDD